MMPKQAAWGSFHGCRRGLNRTLNASPVILLSLIFAWCYWAFHFRLCWNLFQDHRTAQGTLYLIFSQPFFFMSIWCFWKVTRTSPGYTINLPRDQTEVDSEAYSNDREDAQLLNERQRSGQDGERPGRPSVAILDVEANRSSVSLVPRSSSRLEFLPITVKRCGARRFCQKCQHEKYDRTHHCRVCKSCVLKMDHHCPWINNCVGFYNYKFFYLFILYSSFLCIYIFSATLPPTIRVLNEPLSVLGLDLNWLVLLFLSGIFGIFLIPFTLFHTRQLLKNRTTIEFYEKANFRMGTTRRGRVDILRNKHFNPWDLGARNNFIQVMGNNRWNWFLPVGTPQGNGFTFPINEYAYNTLDTGADDDVETF